MKKYEKSLGTAQTKFCYNNTIKLFHTSSFLNSEKNLPSPSPSISMLRDKFKSQEFEDLKKNICVMK